MPRKMARQTLERHAGACCAGSRPYLGSGLLGSPENHYNLPHFRVHPGNPGLGKQESLLKENAHAGSVEHYPVEARCSTPDR